MARVRRIERFVPLPPEAVADRLREHTRWSLLPGQGSVLTDGDAPLRGRVSSDGFTVSLNQRDLMGRVQATARGRLRMAPGGTKVEATVSVPPGMLWYMRIVPIVVPLLLIGAAITLFVSGAPLEAVGLLFALLVMVMSISVGSIGLHMNNADAQVDPLTEQVEALLTAIPSPPTGQSVRQSRPVPQRERG